MRQRVEGYLRELELALSGADPTTLANAVADAREYLTKEAWDCRRRHPEWGEERAFAHVTARFGEPADAARAYLEAHPEPIGWRAWYRKLCRIGYAPGWRITCRGCGRSAPLQGTAPFLVRLGARSGIKRVLVWCSECHRPRFGVVERTFPRAGRAR